MSRVYATVTLPYKELVPKFSVETADHTGGSFAVGGLHPSSIATLVGKGPDVKKQPRFDLKFNLNSQRTSLSVVVNTTKQLPHLEWSSSGGLGKLPTLGLGALASQFLPKAPPNNGPRHARSSRPSSESSKYASGRQRGHKSSRKQRPGSNALTDRRDDVAHKPTNPSRTYRCRYEEPVPLAEGTGPQRSRGNSSGSESRRAARRFDRGYDSGYASAEDSDIRMRAKKSGLNRGGIDELRKPKGSRRS